MATAVLNVEQLQDRKDDQLGYAGNIEPHEAWSLLAGHEEAVLVDVRTQPEWVFVGTPDISALGKKTVGIAWKQWPTMEVNSAFLSQLEQAAPNKDAPVCFICKTGGRSLDAAVEATKGGYAYAFNISYGFEGDKDPQGHRGTTTGWKATGLSWEQQ